MSNLQLRLISAAVLIPFIFGAIIWGGPAFTIFTLLIFCASLYEWIRLSLKTERKIEFSVFGLVYLSVCFYGLYFLRTGFDIGLYLVLMVLLVVWAADTGAYFIGRKFGKHKMAPSISPNKSWEGLGGAMFFSGLVFTLCVLFITHKTGMENPQNMFHFLELFLIGGLLGYIGQMGDLLESFLKRRSGEKDSSNLIPGHGGVLDRMDSILLVSPFFVLICHYVF